MVGMECKTSALDILVITSHITTIKTTPITDAKHTTLTFSAHFWRPLALATAGIGYFSFLTLAAETAFFDIGTDFGDFGPN